MKVIEKKILAKYYFDVVNERKTFEVRKEDDVKYDVNDLLVLRLWDDEEKRYIADEYIVCQIMYVLRDFEGLADGYVVLGIKTLNVF